MKPYKLMNKRISHTDPGLLKAAFFLMVSIPLLLFLFDMALPLHIRAETKIIPGVMEGFRNWYGHVETLHAHFNQFTFNPLWGEEEESKGRVWFKKPGLMKWQYNFPQEDVIIINEKGLFWYVPEDHQVIMREKDEAFKIISPMSILGENMQLEQDFEIMSMEEILEDPKGPTNQEKHLQGSAIYLKPRNPQVAANQIKVGVRAGDFALLAIEVEETSGNRNRIEFRNLLLDQKIDPGFFVFTPPPETKVISPEDFPSW